MITVSSAIQKNSEMASSRRSVTSGPGDAHAFVKGTGMTADQKAEVAQRKANAAALVAASDKQVFEMKKTLSPESREMYLPNVSDMSMESATKSLGIAEVMIKNKEGAGLNIHGRYGEQDISDLSAYRLALKDFISKQQAAASTSETANSSRALANGAGNIGQEASPDTTAALASGSTVASLYSKVQNMAG